MKICHLTSVHQQLDVRIFHKQCTSLASLYEVHLVVVNGISEHRNNVQIHSVEVRYKKRISRIIKAGNAVLKKAIELNCDVYHIHDPELLRISSALLNIGKKVIYDVHEDVPRQILGKYWIPGFLRNFISFIFEKYENKMAGKMSYIVTATPFICQRFLKINRHCVDINNYPILTKSDNLDDQAIKGNNFCYIGGIDENRGITHLVKAFEKVDARLLLAGEFTPAEYGEKLKELNSWNKVEYLGFLDRKGVSDVMNKSLAGFVTLKPLINYLDSLPVKMFEYMDMALPVIASDFPLWKTIIENNECGICVDPQNEKEIEAAIVYILENKEKARIMGLKGKKLVNELYNWKIEEKKLFSVYLNLR